ncbi:Spc98 family-domain-containing protein [Lasiosphaeria miniovina]|uniref:Spindle pole body component n=1 Tax=Lasiosphaeria miniovina TaxID=1954250 RepID=A0AA40DHP8_9PEZI|nr:Spc98 family-domain-containing protein [Lasiosphaeria miniovina]KAK0701766.1 Spc98 family-domain-containing protein [Lasiosphaeria miniovina]
MLHEILLSLSGHPSPLLRAPGASAGHGGALGDSNSNSSVVSPPERALLASLAHLGDLHVKLISFAAQIATEHPSIICRAVAAAVDSIHLAAFQRKVLQVENIILRKDAALVGAHNIVPLTAVVAEFGGWTRRMEWLWDLVQFMLRSGPGPSPSKAKAGAGPSSSSSSSSCTGARVMDRLRAELQTGYMDVEETATSLVAVAESAWLKQVSAWILYGKLPAFGVGDFFVQRSKDSAEEYVSVSSLLPAFVTPSTATSMLFIGRSLNQIRERSMGDSRFRGTDHLSTQLKQLAALSHPLDSASFSRAIIDIQHFLSRTTLQRLLPITKVVEALQLLRDFFLLRRGEFAMALIQQAEEKIRNRWRRAENLAYEKRDVLGTVVVKEGEVAAVLAKTWAAMGSMQGNHADEDEGIELARDLLRLTLAKSGSTSAAMKPGAAEGSLTSIASSTPFRNLLFSVPVVLTLQIPSPLDLFLSQSDLLTYTAINSYLLSLRRAHLRLTDLWKISSLRRHHPASPSPPYASTRGGREKMRLLRHRHDVRANILRNAWATASAAIFFLGETEGYLQTEIVAVLTDGFHRWLTTGEDEQRQDDFLPAPKTKPQPAPPHRQEDNEDIWLATADPPAASLSSTQLATATKPHYPHDPQTLATAHRLYLRTLVTRLLLAHPSFTQPLYDVLVHIDHLVALVHRLHAVWNSADLEADVGVVDAFVDLAREEREVTADLRGVEARVRRGIEGLVAELRRIEAAGGSEGRDGVLGLLLGKSRSGAVAGLGVEAEEDEEDDDGDLWGTASGGGGQYIPRRVGGVDRLLMKLDFGTWFAAGAVDRAGDRGNSDDDGL